MRNNWWYTVGSSGILLPVGIIVPFTDVSANIPDGWSQWTNASGVPLIGSTTTAGTPGGQAYSSRTSSTNAAHGNIKNIIGWSGSASGSLSGEMWFASRNGHNHSFKMYYTPPRRNQILMKSTEEHKKFPVNTGILADVSVAGCIDVTPTGYLSGNSGADSSDSALYKTTGSWSTTGSHAHSAGVPCNEPPAGNAYEHSAGGNHNHTAGVSVTEYLNKFYLGLWASASEEIAVSSGMYALWESSIPPDGWSICDGNNGTTDLSNKFINFDSSLAGTVAGNGTISYSLTSSTKTHNHQGGYAYRNITAAMDHGNFSHNHTASGTIAYTPINETIIFIKYTG